MLAVKKQNKKVSFLSKKCKKWRKIAHFWHKSVAWVKNEPRE